MTPYSEDSISTASNVCILEVMPPCYLVPSTMDALPRRDQCQQSRNSCATILGSSYSSEIDLPLCIASRASSRLSCTRIYPSSLLHKEHNSILMSLHLRRTLPSTSHSSGFLPNKSSSNFECRARPQSPFLSPLSTIVILGTTAPSAALSFSLGSNPSFFSAVSER